MSSHFPTENPPSKETNSYVGSPSPRKKRNNSTPTRNAAEKKQILQQLIAPHMKSKVKETQPSLREMCGIDVMRWVKLA